MKITFEDIAYTFIGILYVVPLIASVALIYGMDENISGKKKYITDAFNNWSVYLYELMEW